MLINKLRVRYQGYRHNVYVLRNRFVNEDDSKNDFQPSNTGVYGYWFYILIEESLTIIIKMLQTLEDWLHKS